MSQRPSFWAYFRLYPPAAVRLMARTGKGRSVRVLSVDEISAASGISQKRIRELERSFSWAGIDVIEAEAFCRGCQFDPTSTHDRRHKDSLYLSSCAKHTRMPFFWLRQSQQWPHFQRIIKQWMENPIQEAS